MFPKGSDQMVRAFRFVYFRAESARNAFFLRWSVLY